VPLASDKRDSNRRVNRDRAIYTLAATTGIETIARLTGAMPSEVRRELYRAVRGSEPDADGAAQTQQLARHPPAGESHRLRRLASGVVRRDARAGQATDALVVEDAVVV
jgi:hypothetical protein